MYLTKPHAERHLSIPDQLEAMSKYLSQWSETIKEDGGQEALGQVVDLLGVINDASNYAGDPTVTNFLPIVQDISVYAMRYIEFSEDSSHYSFADLLAVHGLQALPPASTTPTPSVRPVAVELPLTEVAKPMVYGVYPQVNDTFSDLSASSEQEAPMPQIMEHSEVHGQSETTSSVIPAAVGVALGVTAIGSLYAAYKYGLWGRMKEELPILARQLKQSVSDTFIYYWRRTPSETAESSALLGIKRRDSVVYYGAAADSEASTQPEAKV